MDKEFDMKSNKNWLANVFSYIHEVVEKADRPISLLVMVLLPFIAPLLPALITADSLRTYMKFPSETWYWIAVIAFEMIGYLGMISLVGAIMRLVKNSDPNKVDGLKWNRSFYIGAYATYLVTLISSNVILEITNDVPLPHVLVIFCLTVGLSVSAGILNASRIFDRDEKADAFLQRQERREDRLKGKALKAGINPFTVKSMDAQSTHFKNTQKDDWRLLTVKERQAIKSMNYRDVMQEFGVRESTAFAWISKSKKL